MKKDFRSRLSFTQSEQRGLLALSIIIIVLLLLPEIQAYFFPEPMPDYSAFEAEIAAFEARLEPMDEEQVKHESKLVLTTPGTFDPNVLTQEEWTAIGIPSSIANRITKYVNKGGRFRKKEDIKKIYGFKEQWYQAIEEDIQIETNTTQTFKREIQSELEEEDVLLLVDINRADTSAFQTLNGIGPVLSGRIIAYRNSLGGFVQVRQLSEVYGVEEDLISSLASQLVMDSLPPRRININTCEARQLKSHPYIRKWNIANALVNYRQQHGLYESVEDIMAVHLIDDSLFRKIEPYLTIQ